MNAPVQTSPVPPSIALALMAWKLAWLRVFNTMTNFHLSNVPVHRDEIEPMYPASVEYYHILRRIEDGEAP